MKRWNGAVLRRHRLLISLFLSVACGLCGYGVYVQLLNAALAPIAIPVAARYLKAGTLIGEGDIRMLEVPGPTAVEGVIRDPQELIGKAVNTYNSVAEGSMFYRQLLIEKENLNDVSAFPLNENEAAVSIDADIKTSYANSILPGHQIDLYFQGYASMQQQEKMVLYGQLVRSARVIAVRDSSGKNIDAQSEKPTSVIVVALTYEDADLVQRAKFFGSVIPMITYGSLNPENPDTEYYDVDKMRDILYQRTIDVALIGKEAMNEQPENL